VVEVRTLLPPRDLLAETQRIERELGRERIVKWGPRSLDIDILWYHGFSSLDGDLAVPHPRVEERRLSRTAGELVPISSCRRAGP
jgi:2-amino-4-hydroxy-6-hydroxymethyldihydropteridine diphosphokinase